MADDIIDHVAKDLRCLSNINRPLRWTYFYHLCFMGFWNNYLAPKFYRHLIYWCNLITGDIFCWLDGAFNIILHFQQVVISTTSWIKWGICHHQEVHEYPWSCRCWVLTYLHLCSYVFVFLHDSISSFWRYVLKYVSRTNSTDTDCKTLVKSRKLKLNCATKKKKQAYWSVIIQIYECQHCTVEG